MKYTLFALLALLASCNAPKPKDLVSVANENILAFIKVAAHDPGSYQPIETVIVDTIYFRENMAAAMEDANKAAKTYEDMINEIGDKVKESKAGGYYESMRDSYDQYLQNDKDRLMDEQKRIERLVAISDSVSKSPNNNPICAYFIHHTCRLNNKMGALNLSKYYIQTNASGGIISFSDDEKEMLLYPNLDGKAALVQKK